MQLSLLLCISLFLLTACREEPETAIAPPTPAADTRPAIVVQEPLRAEACELLPLDSLRQFLGEVSGDLTLETTYHEPGNSTCTLTWDAARRTLVLRYRHEGKDSTAHAIYLDHLLEEGEAIDPADSTLGRRSYTTFPHLADAAVWSEQGRILQWQLGNEHLLSLRLTHVEEDLPVEEDRALLRQVARLISEEVHERDSVNM